MWCHYYYYYGVIKRRCDNPATHWRPKIKIRHASRWSSRRDRGAASKTSAFGLNCGLQPMVQQRPRPSASTAAFGLDGGLRPLPPLLGKRCCCVAESWVNGAVTLTLFLLFITMLLCSRCCCVAESWVNGAVTLSKRLFFIIFFLYICKLLWRPFINIRHVYANCFGALS